MTERPGPVEIGPATDQDLAPIVDILNYISSLWMQRLAPPRGRPRIA